MSRAGRSEISVEQMTGYHIPAALQFCRDAGWNQLRNDWQRLLTYGQAGCFVAICQGELVGTVTTTRYGSDVAWIGMMLIAPEFRRRGIASELIRTSIEYLASHRVKCIKLDATPAGETVYEQLGFEVEWPFHRWQRVGSMHGIPIPGNGLLLPGSIMELDRCAFGADRRDYVNLLASESHVLMKPGGYGMLRSGHLASYLGPVAAASPAIAQTILTELLSRDEGTIFWDIPSPNIQATELARGLGFVPIRDLNRMCLGTPARQPALKLQFAIADPGTG